MNTYSWDQVVAWLGLVVPLGALAWAALQHVRTARKEQEYREYRKLFEVMNQLGSKDSTVAGNMAAVFELRKFPEYKDVILRLCAGPAFEGRDTELNKMLAREMLLTSEYLKASA